MPFGRFRSVGRVAYLAAEMLDTAEDTSVPESERLAFVQAALVQTLKSCHQFALDGGDWKAAWLLTQVRDPYRATVFGGTEAELNLVAQLLKAEADLQGRGRHSRGGAEPGSDKEETGGASSSGAKDSKGPGRGKGKGDGSTGAPKGAAGGTPS